MTVNSQQSTQAFDTVSHEFLQIALRDHGIPDKFWKLIEVIYSNAIGRIKGSMGYKLDPFPIRRGVLQGCILSPILFVLCLNSVWKRTPQHGWRIIPGWLLDEISYADDIAMIDITKMTGIQTRFQEFSNKVNKTATMRINIPKTVHMTIAPRSLSQKPQKRTLMQTKKLFDILVTYDIEDSIQLEVSQYIKARINVTYLVQQLLNLDEIRERTR